MRLNVWLLLVFAAWAVAETVDAQSNAPEPESVEIETADGVTLRGTFYPPHRTPRAPIAVLLGDEGESRAMLKPLATSLQTPAKDSRGRAAGEGGKKKTPISWAVLAVDLRCQGDSVTGHTRNGAKVDLSGMKLSKKVLTAMVQQDMEAVRRFLVARNDAGEINLNKLAYVGVGMGALVATNAAAVDWSVRQLNTGKQGQDVKALALVSPPWNLKGVGMLNALRQPGVQKEVAVMLLYGEDHRKSAGDAEKIYRQLSKARGDMPEATSSNMPSLMDVGGPSKLTGSAWLKQAGPDGETVIHEFLNQHVAERDFTWSKRRLE